MRLHELGRIGRIFTGFFVGLMAAAANADAYQDALAGFAEQTGLVSVHSAPQQPETYLTLPSADADGTVAEFIYATRLTTGLGSNPVGLDRGYGDSGIWLRLRRAGANVVFEQMNARYVALTDNTAEAQATAQSFATSILFVAPIVAERGDGALLVDITRFLLRDTLGVARRLQATGQGNFSLASDRSFVTADPLVFPDNLEFDTTLTFVGIGTGNEVRATAPNADAVTLGLHHSFIRLPDAGFETRSADARAAVISVLRYDLARPLAEPLPERLARRFRLSIERSAEGELQVKEPIVFYVDRGAPEPVRSALVEGALWWRDAFEAAGLNGAYDVRVLPEGVHPLDARYNVVQWVHRQTRGWSYGGGVADPRTGEMLKGHVILGSQRIRHDRMIFEGLAGRANTGSGQPNDPLMIALARVRQLAAHEVGHALGFAHNMAASAVGRASVMDYPAPDIRVTANDTLDFGQAYAVGIGSWDKATVRWLYGTENAADREAMLLQAYESGEVFVEDRHARPVGGAHPAGSLWDNGSDPVTALDTVMDVRRIALAGFGTDRLAEGAPLSDLQTVLTPVYLYHRYQILAAAKVIGGAEFNYAVAGGREPTVRPVPSDAQRLALDALIRTLDPDTLAVPDHISRLMQPPNDPFEPILGRERLSSLTSPLFDSRLAARTAASLTLTALLHPARLNRVHQYAQDADDLGVTEIVRAVINAGFRRQADSRAARLAQSGIREAVVHGLIHLAGDSNASPATRGPALDALKNLVGDLSNARGRNREDAAELRALAHDIQQWLANPSQAEARLPDDADTPPGSPIGNSAEPETCWHCEGGLSL